MSISFLPVDKMGMELFYAGLEMQRIVRDMTFSQSVCLSVCLSVCPLIKNHCRQNSLHVVAVLCHLRAIFKVNFTSLFCLSVCLSQSFWKSARNASGYLQAKVSGMYVQEDWKKEKIIFPSPLSLMGRTEGQKLKFYLEIHSKSNNISFIRLRNLARNSIHYNGSYYWDWYLISPET